MKDQEFDIYVRNLMQGAQEPVPASVWKGVEAGLNARRRVIPVWIWSLAATAVAAAVIAGIVFLPHSKDPVVPSNPTILADASVTAATSQQVAPAAEAMSLETEVQVAELRPQRSVRPVTAVAATPEAVHSTESLASEVVSARPQLVPIRVAPQPKVLLADAALMEQLARTEEKKEPQRGFSIMAAGNVQGKVRQDVPMVAGNVFAKPGSQTRGEHIEELSQDNFGLPFSAGLNVKYNFTSRWALGVGLRYTNLSRTFLGVYDTGSYAVPFEGSTTIDNQQHWMGVPVNVYYDIVNRGRWRVHAFGGGSFEYLLDNDYLVHAEKDIHYHEPGSYFMWSAGAGLGVEFKLTPHWGLFLDPSVRYYFFNKDDMPRSLRTVQPLRFDIEAGVRFSFGKF